MYLWLIIKHLTKQIPMITTNRIIEIFCITDDFYKEYEWEIQKEAISAPYMVILSFTTIYY